MATRQVLSALAAQWQKDTDIQVNIESVGGVDALKRVQAGESFDGVVLASDTIDKLLASGHAVAGSRVDLVRSSVAVAVKTGALLPDISTEAALRRAVGTAPSIGYSTGPSGVALLKLLERWGILDALRPRIVQAPAGVPVGELVARGDVAMGFQQLSELMCLQGIVVVGLLPAAVAITTIFSAAACATTPERETLSRLFTAMAASDTASVKQRFGMQPA